MPDTELESVDSSDNASTTSGRPQASDRLRSGVYVVSEAAKAHLRRKIKARQLTPIRIREALHGAKYVAVLTVKNEAMRVPYLLRYYRGLGIQHFVVIDNGSTDGLRESLAGEPDVSAYLAADGYKKARFGVDWVNEVLYRHCLGKWILFVDADEFLVVADDAHDIPAVCAALERRGRRSLQTMMLDMYSDRLADENVIEVDQDPLEVCNLYDSSGYVRRFEVPSNTTWIKGGIRGRMFFANDLWAGPALNKTPLVKWRRGDAFLKSAHELFPRSLNGGHGPVHGALLHFKFTSEATSKAVDPVAASEHTSEYGAYLSIRETRFVSEITRSYSGPSALVADGIITSL